MSTPGRRRQNPRGQMSLAEHFKELRRRVLISIIAVVAGAVVGWIFYEHLFEFFMGPLEAVAEEREDALIGSNFTTVTEPFTVQLRMSLLVGVLLGSPVWLWQGWRFVLPGLTKRERKVAISYFAAAVPLFVSGTLLAAWVLPRAVAILLSFTPEGASNLQSAEMYLKFVTYLAVAFGIAFLLPVLMVGLNALRIFPVRAMIKGWRIALLCILVFAAFVTPDPSAWAMFALALPMFALYWGAVAVSSVLERRRNKRDADLVASWKADDEPPQQTAEADPR